MRECHAYILFSQIRQAGSTLHMFGHSHLNINRAIDDVRYLQNARGYREKQPEMSSDHIFCVWEGEEPDLLKSLAPIFESVVPSTEMLTKPTARLEPDGSARWVVDISTWSPKPAEWEVLVNCISEEEASRVAKYTKIVDRKRAMVSRLMQRAASRIMTGLPQKEIRLSRTRVI